jgi:hypothetical protein
MSTITKVRIREEDVEYINLLAFKLTALEMKTVTAAEVLNGLIKYANESGAKSPDELVKAIRNLITPTRGAN